MNRPTRAQLLKYFLYLGSLGFGGPVALVGYMQRDLVERRGWFTKDEYMKSLALSQLAPGPLAAQVAICLGYVHSRLAGATLVSLVFILPSFVMTLGISWLYGGVGTRDRLLALSQLHRPGAASHARVARLKERRKEIHLCHSRTLSAHLIQKQFRQAVGV